MGNFSFATSKRFAPLFATQFLGALNDNLFKTAVFVLVSFHSLGQNPFLPPEQLLNIGAMLFILPYFLFSALSGEISTKFDKAYIARWVKILEVLIMILAGVGFYYASSSILFLCLFLMGTHSTLFGPLKYAILPDYLKENELVAGNGLIETGTFIAILLGQIIGTAMVAAGAFFIGSLTIIIAALGIYASFNMPHVAAKNPYIPININIYKSSMGILSYAFKNHDLKTAIIGISWFWFVGAIYTTQLPTFVSLHLGGNVNVFNFMLTLFSIGIGVGSMLCAKISHGKINLRFIIYAAIALVIIGCILSFMTLNQHADEIVTLRQFLSTREAYLVSSCIIGLGIAGGFFSIPLYTWLQIAADDTFRANAIAANNIINAIFMVAAAIFSATLLTFFMNISFLYLLTALGNIIAIYILIKMSPKIWHGL